MQSPSLRVCNPQPACPKTSAVILRGTFAAWLLSVVLTVAGNVEDYAAKVAPLIDPVKLATLARRGANPRVQKVTAVLADAKAEGVSIDRVCDMALSRVAMTNKLAIELTKAAMLRNVEIAERLGCINAAGLAEMRRGRAATVGRGPYAGDNLSVDHIIPASAVPQLKAVIANLELMPGRMNSRKNARIGQQQFDLARKLSAAGLLNNIGFIKLLQASNANGRHQGLF